MDKHQKIRKAITILQFALFLAIVIGLPVLVMLRHPEFIEQFKSLEDVNRYLDQYKVVGYLVYMGLLIAEVIISILPSQIIQIAAGYAFSIPMALIFTILGAAIGSSIAFALSRTLGKGFIYMIFGETRMRKFVNLLSSKKGIIAIFLIYLIPGIPKDIFTYAAGISRIRWISFLFISIGARTPSFIASILFGYFSRTKSYTAMIIVAAIILATFAIGIIKREKVFRFINNKYDKISKTEEM
ncbi:MAG: VTT domain-containing protein [Clostridiales Family XIII bacterium]|jgi:uncharacterized membrane protein YdjX (TVP38/TMEM64 family)|nr:VTT domain-containing protein [Clostridiales Family XIII bacterium]